VERRLRSVIQKHKDVSYIFLGSRKHLIQKMFLDQSRPLYRAAGHYPLGSIATEHWIPFVGRKFREGEKAIAADAIRAVCKFTEGHPFYTQHLCHSLWELCEPGEAVMESLIEAAIEVSLDRESYAYTALNGEKGDQEIDPFSAAGNRILGGEAIGEVLKSRGIGAGDKGIVALVHCDSC
jgi:hypothetical protein